MIKAYRIGEENFRPLDLLPKSKADKFVFYEGASILPQIKTAIDSIEKQDYTDFLKYLQSIWEGRIEASEELREGALKLYELLNNNNQVGASKKITYQQENIANYLYLLVADTSILKAYMHIGLPNMEQVENIKITNDQRLFILKERQKRNKELWQIFIDKAISLAPAYTTKGIETFARSLDMVSQNLYHIGENVLSDGFYDIVEKVGRSKAVTHIGITNNELLKERGINFLSSFDMFVHDVCVAIQDAGNEVTTVNRIYWTMRGLRGRADRDSKPTGAMREAILKSVIKLMQFGVSIDATDVLKKYHISGESPRHISVLLPCEILDNVYLNGNVLDSVVKFTGISPIKKNAMMKNQMRSYDADLLDVSNVSLSVTEENMPVGHYLIGCIEGMKKPADKPKAKTRSKLISIDTLIEKLQYSGRRDRLAKLVGKFLQSWTNRKYISGFTENKDSRGKLLSVEIKTR